ncbi:MAG TPA: hypothetical protein VGR49_00015 [Actinomycetota bacterium]|jgi:hypothetical protein|nr:hypothetical protein [Actinomycetota bacterium]
MKYALLIYTAEGARDQATPDALDEMYELYGPPGGPRGAALGVETEPSRSSYRVKAASGAADGRRGDAQVPVDDLGR